MPTKLQNGYLPREAKKPYSEDIKLSSEDFSVIFDFAYEMAFGSGYHRSNRSGGSQRRNANLIFRDVMEGKIGEFGVYRYLEDNGVRVTPPDCEVHGKGVWDGGDFQFRNQHNISVKTSKHFAQLLLLEAEDYYVDNNTVFYKNDKNPDDIIIFTRTKNNIGSFMKDNKGVDMKDIKWDMYHSSNISCEITGYINNKDFKNLIDYKFIIHKGTKLNGKVPMDADNYYIPAKEMKSKENLCRTLLSVKNDHEHKIQKHRESKLPLHLGM